MNAMNPTPPATPEEQNARACRERCAERLASLRTASERLSAEDIRDDEREAIESEFDPLEIEQRLQFKILLAWGGPSDGFLLTFDNTNFDLLEGVYFHADWFTYAEEKLILEEAQTVADIYLHGDPAAYFSRGHQ